MTEIVIAAAARTPVGAFNGAFASLPGHALGTVAIKAALERAGVGPDEVDEVILGQVLTGGAGQNPARQAAIAAGIPVERTAFSINLVCGSGLRAVALAAQQIATGDATIVVAGGQESMTQAPHAQNLRSGQKMGPLEFVDTMLKDGLWDAFHGYHMGTTAENVAEKYQITREQQDGFAANSQRKAGEAIKAGRFKDEIAPVTVKTRKGETVVDTDEYPKPETTAEVLAKLRPAFSKTGTVTAGNASGINDGAAVAVVMSAEEARKRGVKPLARIVSWATAGVDPSIMGTGPIPASRRALQEGGLGHRHAGPDRGQRGLRGAGLRGEQGPRLGPGEGERQRRRHRHGPPDRRERRAGAEHAAVRDAAARGQARPRDAVHRRRDGRRDVRGAGGGVGRRGTTGGAASAPRMGRRQRLRLGDTRTARGRPRAAALSRRRTP